VVAVVTVGVTSALLAVSAVNTCAVGVALNWVTAVDGCASVAAMSAAPVEVADDVDAVVKADDVAVSTAAVECFELVPVVAVDVLAAEDPAAWLEAADSLEFA